MFVSCSFSSPPLDFGLIPAINAGIFLHEDNMRLARLR